MSISVKISKIVAVLAWLVLLVMLYADHFLFEKGGYLVYTTYMVAVSLILVKYVEKGSIRERFGFQKHNVLGTLLSCLVFVVVFALSGRERIREGIVSVTEEIFFRGYLLGAVSCMHVSCNYRLNAVCIFTKNIIFHIANIC